MSPRRATPAAQPQPAPTDESLRARSFPMPVLLFRYSALTFNGHRIHYDRSYVTEVEGYPGLIVHGPLIATLLLDLLRREHPDARVRRFSFKAVSPLFDIHRFTVCGKTDGDRRYALWARNHEGALAMEASAENSLRPPCSTNPTSIKKSATPYAQLCRQFPDEYFREIDEQRGYPEEFVDALTKAGWLAALIPRSTAARASASPRRP